MQNQSYTSSDKMLGHCEKTSSFSPILIGGLVGLGLGFLMDLFSVSIGLSLFTTDPAGARALAATGIIGMLIGTIFTMYLTGFVAGYVSAHSCGRKNLGMIYGFAAWCFSLILIVLLGMAMNNYMMGYSGFMPHAGMQTARSQAQLTLHENASAANDTMNPTVMGDTTRTEREVKTVGMQSFVIFILFLAGAISSAIGGHVGYRCWFNHKQHHHTHT